MIGKRNICRRLLGLLVLSLLYVQFSAAKAKSPQPASLSIEQQQQFTYYWYAAKQAIEEERYADALILLEFCNAINPNDGQTLHFLGILYDGLDQHDRALEAYRHAYEVAPGDQWYKYSQALLAKRTRAGVKEAIIVLENAEKQNPTNEELLELLGRLYSSDEQWKKAIQTQDKLDKIRGFDGYSAINRYRIYFSWNKPKKAMEVIDSYIKQDPANIQYLPAIILNNYAYQIATHRGDLKLAEQMSEKTIREQPNNPIFLDTYGWIMHLQGQDELALFYLRKALWNADESTRPEIEQHIKQIEK